ncbi:MAG TPA: transglycosylase SLT domain-containing protein [Polyangiaceae bacterium]|nr:transglycosylase SLT domain-containing protein [Polyangiaceae bacterium]
MPTLLARRVVCAFSVGCCLVWPAFPARASEPPPPKEVPPKPAPAAASTRPAAKPLKVGHSSDAAARRFSPGVVANGEPSSLPENATLRALREAERELFPGAPAVPESAWPGELPSPAPRETEPAVLASGLPPASPLPPVAVENEPKGWLEHLDMPDLPVRWDERVVRYLRFFHDDPRGHATFANLYRHSGRWREMVRRVLRRKSLPEDIAWVSMIESGFDPTVRSRAGAAGLWQFMPDTAKLYGLVCDRWLDQRLDATLATEAAADFLADLHHRFGSWELALAAFNMGSVGLASVVRHYNTNDFWSLSRIEGTLPWETTLYVPKVLAAAVVARNLAAFGFADLVLDSAVETDELLVPAGTSLATLAQAAGCTTKDLDALNPELRAERAPPGNDGDAAYLMKVPQGKGAAALRNLARLRRDQPPLDRYVVRFGETLEDIAAAHKTSAPRLVELNAISPGEVVRGGTVLFVPHAEGATAPPAVQSGRPAGPGAPSPKPSVVVPADVFVYPDRRRVFYRVIVGDTLEQVAGVLHVSRDDLRRWNDLDATARLQDGMTLQAFVSERADLSRVRALSEADVRVLAVGSDEFFAAMQQDRGVRRLVVAARAGDTIESVGRRFDVPARTMERINRRSRRDALKSGETVVVYLPAAASDRLEAKMGANVAEAAVAERAPNGSLPAAPAPGLLP